MKITQVCYRRYPSPVHNGGGDVRRWQDLCALTDLGHQVDVVVCDPSNQHTSELERRAAGVHVIHTAQSSRWRLATWLARALNPETRDLRFPNLLGLRDQAYATIRAIRPDLVWAEQTASVPLCPHDSPIVHSHLDFMFKLRSVRRRSYASWLRRPDALTPSGLEKLEIDLCRDVAHTMCGSQTEADFLRSHGVSASYLPVVGPTVPRPSFDALPECRLFLFGKPNTAMRAARHHLQAEIWPILERQGLDLDWHQLGDKPRPGADPSWPWVEANFTVHGHVDELGSVLRAGDASVMPYPWDTGGRAKFGVSAGYGVVNIAYDTTFLCASEFTPGEDSLAAASPEHFVELLREFTADISFRRRLSEASRETYERHHTTEVQLPRYDEIVHVAAG